jgi:hypothetical protein
MGLLAAPHRLPFEEAIDRHDTAPEHGAGNLDDLLSTDCSRRPSPMERSRMTGLSRPERR